MQNQPPLYSIVETDRFQQEVSRITGTVRRWDEIKDSVDWILARYPHAGQQINETGVWAMPLESDPLMTVYYTINYDDRQVTLEAVFVRSE